MIWKRKITSERVREVFQSSRAIVNEVGRLLFIIITAEIEGGVGARSCTCRHRTDPHPNWPYLLNKQSSSSTGVSKPKHPTSPVAIMKPTAASMAQDLPPTGGYEPVQYKVSTHEPLLDLSSNLPLTPPSNKQRNLPARGFRPSYYLAAVGLIMTWGLYKYVKGAREHKYAATLLPYPTLPPVALPNFRSFLAR